MRLAAGSSCTPQCPYITLPRRHPESPRLASRVEGSRVQRNRSFGWCSPRTGCGSPSILPQSNQAKPEPSQPTAFPQRIIDHTIPRDTRFANRHPDARVFCARRTYATRRQDRYCSHVAQVLRPAKTRPSGRQCRLHHNRKTKRPPPEEGGRSISVRLLVDGQRDLSRLS